MDRICRVGLTGGLASGKSSVAAILAARGVPVLDADAAVHELYAAGAAGAEVVRETLGPGVMTPDGSVDRASLAALVLTDDEARERLNRVVHPLVRRRAKDWFGEIAAPAGVVEAALLVETGSWRLYDVLVVVSCRPEQQIDRALGRGLSHDTVEAVIRAQAPLAEKVSVADVIIDNSGGKENLEIEVERAWREVRRLCGLVRHSSGGSSHSVS